MAQVFGDGLVSSFKLIGALAMGLAVGECSSERAHRLVPPETRDQIRKQPGFGSAIGRTVRRTAQWSQSGPQRGLRARSPGRHGPHRRPRLVWRHRWAGATGTVHAPLLVGPLVIYAGRREILAADRSSGRRRWSVSVRLGGGVERKLCRGSSPPVVSGDLVLVASCDGYLRAINWRVGIEAWRVYLSGPSPDRPLIQGQRVFAAAHEIYDAKGNVRRSSRAWLYAVDIDTGKVAFKQALRPMGIATQSFYGVAHGREPEVYFLERGGVLAVNSRTGAIRWRHAGATCPPVLSGGLVLTGRRGGLIALERVSGLTSWSRSRPGSERASSYVPSRHCPMVVGHDGVLTWETRRLVFLRLSSARRQWRSLSPRGQALRVGAVIVAGGEGEIRGVDSRDGKLLWRAGGVFVASSLAVDYRAFYYGAGDWTLHARELRTGKLLWSYRDPRVSAALSAGPTLGDGSICFTSDVGYRYALR